MKQLTSVARLAAFGGIIFGLLACRPGGDDESFETPPEADTGEWISLIDGPSLDAWKGYRTDQVPAGWSVEDGVLSFDSEDGRGDLVTKETFGDFELELEWKIPPGGNSGIIYRASETGEASWHTGPELQIIDDEGYPDPLQPAQLSGANYDLHPPSAQVVQPAGEWNTIRLIANGPHVEHWLNGTKVVEYELWSGDWEEKVQASKFAEFAGYGRNQSGHIVLQDHDGQVWFRNVRIRRL